ncbi:hypothetical protein BpHYR1_010229 [Brachionus plicatilis]|uniref:Uncharacterized protein n=1 Tax=Brachionus plicatilis TaxID=10195 RepID=A0A3M7Q2L8_BRAPC|nr:hypothetical protein BpHYR1_010229 [Brachionus plicatilis]
MKNDLSAPLKSLYSDYLVSYLVFSNFDFYHFETKLAFLGSFSFTYTGDFVLPNLQTSKHRLVVIN